MKDIKGVLSIANKIWFNDDTGRCRLRICGFNDKQINQLKNHGLCDITVTEINEDKDRENNRVYEIKAVMSIEDNIFNNDVKFENKRYTVLKTIHLKIKDINDVGVWTTGKFTRNKGVINEGTVLDFSSEFQNVYDFYINNTLEEAEFSEEEIKKFVKDGVFEEWFEEVCWVCNDEKLVHNDERTGHDNPGFICRQCEDNRNRSERMLERVMIGD